MIPAHRESLQTSSALVPTLKRHLGKMDLCWVNPKGALDKQGEKEREGSGRNLTVPGAPVQQALSAPDPATAPRVGSCLCSSGEARAGLKPLPLTQAGWSQHPCCLCLPGLLLVTFLLDRVPTLPWGVPFSLQRGLSRSAVSQGLASRR